MDSGHRYFTFATVLATLAWGGTRRLCFAPRNGGGHQMMPREPLHGTSEPRSSGPASGPPGAAQGREPRAGDRIWLTSAAGAQFVQPRWFRVHRVEPAWLPSHLYLIGCYETGGADTVPVREYVLAAGLYVDQRAGTDGGTPYRN